MESEWYALFKAVQEAFYLRMIFEKSGFKIDPPLFIKEVNKACISYFKDPGDYKLIKHIDYRHFFVRDQVIDGRCNLIIYPVNINYQTSSLVFRLTPIHCLA